MSCIIYNYYQWKAPRSSSLRRTNRENWRTLGYIREHSGTFTSIEWQLLDAAKRPEEPKDRSESDAPSTGASFGWPYLRLPRSFDLPQISGPTCGLHFYSLSDRKRFSQSKWLFESFSLVSKSSYGFLVELFFSHLKSMSRFILKFRISFRNSLNPNASPLHLIQRFQLL